jgi:DNA-binding transcriptional LysR family regulator
MVSIDCLAALDHLLWLRTGQRAAAQLGTTQPTVSRNTKHCSEVFNIKVAKTGGEWEVLGDPSLLDAERNVHQRYRWDHQLPLRLDGQYWTDLYLQGFTPPDWIKGNFNYSSYERPLALIRSGVLDAWICSYPDVPEDHRLTGWQISRSRIDLVVKRGHPLLQLGDNLSLNDLAAYPLMPRPEGAFPQLERMLASVGLGESPERTARIQASPWFGKVPIEDRTVLISSPLTRNGHGERMVRLPVNLPFEKGDLLVVRSDFTHHGRTAQLARDLQDHLRTIASGQDGFTVLEQPVLHKPAVTPVHEPQTASLSSVR